MNAEHYTPDEAARWQELCLLMHEAWGRIPLGVDGSPLVDTERLTELFALAHNPYHRLAWGGLDTLGILTICVNGLLEARQFDKAARVIVARDRIRREWDRTGYVEPAGEAPPPPAPHDLPPSPVPIIYPPPEGAGQEWVNELPPFTRALHAKYCQLERAHFGDHDATIDLPPLKWRPPKPPD